MITIEFLIIFLIFSHTNWLEYVNYQETGSEWINRGYVQSDLFRSKTRASWKAKEIQQLVQLPLPSVAMMIYGCPYDQHLQLKKKGVCVSARQKRLLTILTPSHCTCISAIQKYNINFSFTCTNQLENINYHHFWNGGGGCKLVGCTND